MNITLEIYCKVYSISSYFWSSFTFSFVWFGFCLLSHKMKLSVQEIYYMLLMLFRLLFWYFSKVSILFINSKNCTSNCLFSELRTSLSMLLIVIDSLTVVFLEPPFLYAYCINKTCIWTRIHNWPVWSNTYSGS